MYTETCSTVRVYNSLSKPFAIVSLLAPFLFNLVIDWAMHEATEKQLLGIALDDMLTDLDFADDICLLDDNIGGAQTLLDLVTNAAAKGGLEINISKTKFCSACPEDQMKCNGKPIEKVDSFTYLGRNLQLDVDVSHEVRTRLGKATGRLKQLDKLWKQRSIPPRIKAKLYKACVQSVLLYGCESWPVKIWHSTPWFPQPKKPHQTRCSSGRHQYHHTKAKADMVGTHFTHGSRNDTER